VRQIFWKDGNILCYHSNVENLIAEAVNVYGAGEPMHAELYCLQGLIDYRVEGILFRS